eukprot:4374273-Pyramimonas_sp.AAC.1
MSHPVPSLPEQSEREILIPLASYPDAQRKDWNMVRRARQERRQSDTSTKNNTRMEAAATRMTAPIPTVEQ